MQVITKKELYNLLEARHENKTYSRLASIPKPDKLQRYKKKPQKE